jgi:hypothetical protein
LAELFPYIEAQAKRWRLSGAEAEALDRELLRRGIESRVVSMSDPRPFETLITHTSAELRQEIAEVKEPTPPGYLDAFLAVQNKWKHSLNCWSAAPEIPARVLSNWYPIEEGIQLYGSTYDSTEHFWQAVKYHPAVTVGELKGLLEMAQQRDWGDWLKRLDADPKFYLPNAYAVEFLRHNLARDRLRWFHDALGHHDLEDSDRAREVQQRAVANDSQKNATPAHGFRFSAYEEKVLWGDLADLFHLVYTFSSAEDPMRRLLTEHHFDGIYLRDRKLGFISEEYRSLMLEIWKVKYLEMARFGEVIRSIPDEIRLEHFLNDGDSPDIPIPVYVGYLNRIREMARSR